MFRCRDGGLGGAGSKACLRESCLQDCLRPAFRNDRGRTLGLQAVPTERLAVVQCSLL